MNKDEIKKFLKDVNLNYSSRDSKEIIISLKDLKEIAIEQCNQKTSKEIWCLEQILKVQNKYIDAYNAFKSKNYYGGWCFLEDAEIEYGFLSKHFKDKDGEYWLEFIYKHIIQFQSVFPYHIFISPEILIKEIKCGICDQPINLRNHCEHRVGEIYNGELCTRLLNECEVLGISLVYSPVQKYSVVFINDPETGQTIDQYDYSFVRWIIDRLQSPFHNWDMSLTKKRHPHSRYSHIGKNDECPCESGEKYKDCCLLKEGVLRPHYQITFSVIPPKGLSMFDYSDSR